MAHKWRSFPQGVDALVRLDVDLFEDVFDSLAVMIRDDEASEALEALPKNAVGGYALDDVVRWWRALQAKKAAAGSPARRAASSILSSPSSASETRWPTSVMLTTWVTS